MGRKKSITKKEVIKLIKKGVKAKKKYKLELQDKVLKTIVGLLNLFFLIFTFISLQNQGGFLGKIWVNFLNYSVGIYGTYIFLFLFCIFFLGFVFYKEFKVNFTKFIGTIIFFTFLLSFLIIPYFEIGINEEIKIQGGLLGFFIGYSGYTLFGIFASRLLSIILALIGIIMIFQFTIEDIFYKILDLFKNKKNETSKLNIVSSTIKNKEEEKNNKTKKDNIIQKKDSFEIQKLSKEMLDKWKYPSLDLLIDKNSDISIDTKFLHKNAETIKQKLEQFNINVEMKDINVGPTVTQYTLKPEEGVKLSKITTLKNDLALALASKSIRIEAPIPGKSLVGIEVPNEDRMVVYIREILESEEFLKSKSTLTVPLGKLVDGKPIVDNLDNMPHILIAGATGSGKSVGINTFLISLLYQNSPFDLKLILIDPKRVELSYYNGIPHLLTPVIVDPEKAIKSLKWAINEMTRRYKACSEKNARNREEYNMKITDPEDKMPYIIIVVDELADLMMGGRKKEVESLIMRLAQMARAVGIHLILATQRPSVDVITGVIKANIPTRIAFSVVSSVDSRTILDSIGAEDLIGKGDMLYLSSNDSKPTRIQGCFIQTNEIERVVNRIKLEIQPEYNEEIMKDISDEENDMNFTNENFNISSDDEKLVQEAIEVIRETGKASASLLQRRLRLGYARAARILDVLEEQGIVGPAKGSKAREIYL